MAGSDQTKKHFKLRSQRWFDDPEDPGDTAQPPIPVARIARVITSLRILMWPPLPNADRPRRLFRRT